MRRGAFVRLGNSLLQNPNALQSAAYIAAV
jgi:hypothetical protein